jgi:predicted metal-dependent peptidase
MAEPNDAPQRMVASALAQLRRESPFFATLALFARIEVTDRFPTAATDGRDIFVNPAFFADLPPPQRVGVILHEVLHAALQHLPRRGARDAERWNLAADVVVNGMILAQPGLDLPVDVIRKPALEHLSVEEVYHAMLTAPESSGPADALRGDLREPPDGGALTAAWREGLAAHWRHALEQARVISQTSGQGKLPAGLAREFGMLAGARLDWRALLWRFLVQTPVDFSGFDRRFIGRGYYLEELAGEAVRVAVAVDTSGSVKADMIQALLNEVQGILRAYPHIACALYYADAALYGPFDLTADSPIPPPVGRAGTDFRPFFAALPRLEPTPALAVYLTDGFGPFPAEPPDIPTLWALTPGGVDAASVPFGETARMLLEA